jgi:hypothetical protein
MVPHATKCSVIYNTNRENSDGTNSWRIHLRWPMKFWRALGTQEEWIFCRHLEPNTVECYVDPIEDIGFGPIKIMKDDNGLLQIPARYILRQYHIGHHGQGDTFIVPNGKGGFNVLVPGQS